MLLLKEASITGSQSVWRFGHCLGLGVVDKLDRFSGWGSLPRNWL